MVVGMLRALAIQKQPNVPTQKEAIKIATEIAKNQKNEVVIHNQGRIREKNSYGNDPFLQENSV